MSDDKICSTEELSYVLCEALHETLTLLEGWINRYCCDPRYRNEHKKDLAKKRAILDSTMERLKKMKELPGGASTETGTVRNVTHWQPLPPPPGSAPRAQDARDAQRYRWLQSNRGCGNELVPSDEGCYLQLNPRDMDAAIDAAIAAEKGKP
jgi:hypothetical protein